MLTNTMKTIPDLNDDNFRDAWARAMYQGTQTFTDPGAVVTTTMPGSVADGIFSQISTTGNAYNIEPDPLEPDPLEVRIVEMEKKMNLVSTQLTLMRLKILSLEGKFTQEEVANIKKMILSEDEASKTLAETIIENA